MAPDNSLTLAAAGDETQYTRSGDDGEGDRARFWDVGDIVVAKSDRVGDAGIVTVKALLNIGRLKGQYLARAVLRIE